MADLHNETGKSVAFITLGCAKNEVDSRIMAENLSRAGYAVCDDPTFADVIIVNTCSFIQAATEESIEAILDAAEFDNVAKGKARLVIAGCMPARYHDELDSEFPEADAIISCSQEKEIVALIDEMCGIERVDGGMHAIEVESLGSRPSSYVKISDGCDRFCSYCAIPYIRGRYHSFGFDEIRQDVERRVSCGSREIVLIAQDTGRWGQDFDERSTLASLLERLAEEFVDTWFRVMYIQPEGVTDQLIDVVAAHENICSYFDIPFQHANSAILSDMNRSGSAEQFLSLIGKIRARIEDAVIRTTLIAGFPGEDDNQFEELCEFVSEAELDYVGVFAYSREEGTRAFDLPAQVDDDEKELRAQQLRDLADDVSSSVIALRKGKIADVLVCGEEEDGQLFGRTKGQAPDTDGVTYLDGGEIGTIVSVRIEDTLMYEMEGAVLA